MTGHFAGAAFPASQVIPAENLVALAQPGAAGGAGDALRLLAAAGSAAEARLMLEALEAGTSGVLLRTDDPAEVRSLVQYVSRREAEESGAAGSRLAYGCARVVAVRQLASGDRVCVDLAGLVQPGEGLLVGSFARCLALVHSECEESDYIASRPFRVNAGPVHAYVLAPGGRTRYLCELASGSEVLLADAQGRTRTALVGRLKIERRPLVLVEVETEDGSRHSLMLQNAETVKLVGPYQPPPAGAEGGAAGPSTAAAGAAAGAAAAGDVDRGWRAISVAALAPGDQLYVLQTAAARHTGIAIEEFIVEK
ncbi:hypothetical protein GPECTOR_12g387 [Gonium pectorale]|uniref:3-dehydroquinate synthase n=1 Tax=Gonium pectorale TaxID=33097 RepID=A0A150GNR7_GONPE|nr:hypothetical protein GPECTOR_12g387 [Gonium pectorale]|eukprot:KXZ51425.1 hypothetical protein GPECTOR_12g387 [Gonium pectorale]